MTAARRLPLLAALSLSALLAACATTPPPKPLSQGRGAWSFAPANRSESAKLAYGIPNSDDVGLMLLCAQPRVKIWMSQPAAAPPKKIALRSGKAHGVYPLAPEGEALLQATMPAADPVLDAFAASGELIADQTRLDARAANERAAIRAFRGACPAKTR
ncbi:hypothetical protein [Phenylobacterium aquaticum]|uniref:hypothetical protein n=1 Tax=Phenylobacterium aquaticum TaxID=1763816 RepID=UPI001F5D8465|nr:hypothetical protein [Phenylobacterium aquaticum]MCI3134891.1 hypothetical protein [Phenylobacterium aquaticum]